MTGACRLPWKTVWRSIDYNDSDADVDCVVRLRNAGDGVKKSA
jgi:hypothetical protein